MSNKTKKILAVILLLVVAAAAIFAYYQWGPPAQKRAELARRGEAAQQTEQAEKPAPEPTEEASAPAQAAEETAPAVTIYFTAVHGDGSQKEFTIATNELTLRKALEQEKLIEGTESDWGLYVLTVDGETADEAQQQWWCLTKDGEMTPTGVDDTVIADGEHYEFTLTTGW